MLYMELVPPVMTELMLAAELCHRVLYSALDNAGVACTINRLSCRCDESLQLLCPLTDSLSRDNIVMLTGHVHRERNTHADVLSHPFPRVMWNQIVQQARRVQNHRTEIHFAMFDVRTKEYWLATMSFVKPDAGRSSKRGAHVAKH